MKRIYNLLKPGGVCYFAAGNRYNLNIFEPHYKLPFLSWLPKRNDNYYIKIFKDESIYYETHLSYRKLKILVKDFKIIDDTLKIIKNPNQDSATDMLNKNTLKYYMVNFIGKILYFLFPTYIWILEKPR